MLISGMNRYFAKHGKVTFGLIAIVISVSFVLYLSRVSVFDLFRRTGPKKMVLLGREVSGKQRIEAARNIALFEALRNPSVNLQRIPIDPNSDFVTINILKFYAALDLGIRVGDKSVAKFIRSAPSLQTKGQFDIAKYNNFVKTRLRPAHFSKADLDEAVRRKLTIERLQDTVCFNILTTNNELRAAFDSARQKAKADIIWFSGATFANRITPKSEDVKNYFSSHRKQYAHPAKAKAKLVVFPYAQYRTEATKHVTTKNIEAYYRKNRFMYVQEDKTAKNGAPVYKPLVKVSDEIRKLLVAREAQALAFKQAVRFADTLYDSMEDVFYNVKTLEDACAKCAAIFNKRLAKMNLKATESKWIALNAERPLAKALAELSKDNPVSEPIRSLDAVTVAFLVDKQPVKPKTFAEAEKQARADFVKTRSVVLAQEAARKAAAQLAKALAAGTDFKKAVDKLGLKAESLPEIGVSVPLKSPHGALVSQTIFDTHEKAVSQAHGTSDGAFIVYVESKTLPSDKDFKKESRMFAMIYKMSKQQRVYNAFLQTLMAASAPAKKE